MKKNSWALMVLLSALVAIPPLSTDMGLPAYGATAHSLHTDPAAIALTLSFFMLGFAAGPVFIGPASEKYGRKPMLMLGMGLYLIASIFCTVTPTLWLLLAARLVQGIAASSGTVLAVACIRDLFDGNDGRRKMSYVMMINGVMPLAAPSLGVFVLSICAWRTIYGIMAFWGLVLIVAIWFALDETIRDKTPDALSPKRLWAGYREVLTHPVCSRAIRINAFGFGTMFAFISGSPILFVQEMHLSAAAFGILFSVTVSGSMAGTFVANLLHRYGMKTPRVLGLGLSAMVLSTFVLAVLCALHLYAVLPIAVLICLSNFGMGMVGPNASYSAMQYMAHLAGPTSAMLTCTQMVTAAVSAGLMSVCFGLIGPVAMAAVMFAFAVLAGISFLSLPKAPPPVTGRRTSVPAG